MTAPIVACMGGWCRRRNSCAHYHAPHHIAIAERLCEKGNDDPESVRKPERDTRFDAWPAIATPEQRAAWEQRNKEPTP